MTKDITVNPSAAVQIETLDQLKNAVHKLATLQLVLNAAEARQQAAIEAAKKAFDEATADSQTQLAALLAGVQKYAADNKDMLFPLKGKTRTKTYKVLQHTLAYRSSSSIAAPETIVDDIKAMRARIEEMLCCPDAPEAGVPEEALAQIDALDRLIRTKEEFDKTAAKALLESQAGLLSRLKVTETTEETFRVTFNFTPTA